MLQPTDDDWFAPSATEPGDEMPPPRPDGPPRVEAAAKEEDEAFDDDDFDEDFDDDFEEELTTPAKTAWTRSTKTWTKSSTTTPSFEAPCAGCMRAA
jgi:hypothetical protein